MKRAKQVYSLSCLGKFDEAYLPVEKASYTLMTIIRVFFLLMKQSTAKDSWFSQRGKWSYNLLWLIPAQGLWPNQYQQA